MAEIKPMNLPEVNYDPMRGLPQQESLADKLRKAKQSKLLRTMNELKVREGQRAEKDYAINKRAENYIFSNYPSSKMKGDFTTAFQNRKFGPGSREVELEKWRNAVGGNYAAFQQWYDAGKKAENEALYKSFYKNPAKYKSDKAYKKAISDWMNGMSDVEQQQILNEAPAEVLQILQENWDASKVPPFTRLRKNLTFGMGEDDDSAMPELALGTAATIAGGVLAKRFGLPIGQFLRGNRALAGNLDEIAKKARVVAGKSTAKAGQQMDMFGDAIPFTKIKDINSQLAKLVKNGSMNRADAAKLRGVIRGISDRGEKLTGEAIGKALKDGGKKFESLRNSLSNTNLSSIGPLRTTSLLRGMSTGLGLAGLGYAGARMLGEDPEDASTVSAALGTAGAVTNFPGIVDGIGAVKKVIDKKGIGYVMKKIASVGGVKLLGSFGMKAILGGTGIGAIASGALLANDLRVIYNILSDDINE